MDVVKEFGGEFGQTKRFRRNARMGIEPEFKFIIARLTEELTDRREISGIDESPRPGRHIADSVHFNWKVIVQGTKKLLAEKMLRFCDLSVKEQDGYRLTGQRAPHVGHSRILHPSMLSFEYGNLLGTASSSDLPLRSKKFPHGDRMY